MSHQFFQNKDCKYFPCHRTSRPEDFNCLFCYCPLYALGRGCGGNFRYNEKGIKDCTACMFPHVRENYAKVIERFQEIREVVRLADERLSEKNEKPGGMSGSGSEGPGTGRPCRRPRGPAGQRAAGVKNLFTVPSEL